MGPDGQVEDAEAEFKAFLRRNKLKVTGERMRVLRQIMSCRAHVEAEDLLVRMRRAGERVSRATIYRTVELLLRAGLIKKSDFGHSHSHYEFNFRREHHDHMICQRCGKVIEFASADLEEAQRRVCREHDFQVTSRSLQVFGLCAGCRRKSGTR